MADSCNCFFSHITSIPWNQCYFNFLASVYDFSSASFLEGVTKNLTENLVERHVDRFRVVLDASDF